MTENAKYHAPALDKGLEILEYLSSLSIPLSQTEIAEGLSRTPNEIYRMLVSLENKGYIIREEISGKYKLSLKLYHLSHRHSPIDELRNAALRPMENLSQLVRESCHLSILYLNQLMVILHTRSPAAIALSIEEGNLFPLALTGSGKVILAYHSEKEPILEACKEYIGMKPTERRRFMESLKTIKSDGYYIRDSHVAEGVVDISVPIGIGENEVFACLTISRLKTMESRQKNTDQIILCELKNCAKEIEKRIGFDT